MIHNVVHIVAGQVPDDARHAIELLAGTRAGEEAFTHRTVSPVEALSAPADTIVSHLAPSWRGLVYMTKLRAARPNTPIVHVEHRFCERFLAVNELDHATAGSLLAAHYALSDVVVASSATQARWMSRRCLATASKVRVIVPTPSGTVDMSPQPRHIPGRWRIGLDLPAGLRSAHRVVATAVFMADRNDIELRIALWPGDEAPLRGLSMGRSLVTVEPRLHGSSLMRDVHAIALPTRWGSDAIASAVAAAAGLPILSSRSDAVHPAAQDHVIPVDQNTTTCWTEALGRLSPESEGQIPRRVDLGTLQSAFVRQWTALLGEVAGLPLDVAAAA